MAKTGATLRLQVWAHNAKDFFFEATMPLIVPRAGERVRFDDAWGIVDHVDWIPRRGEDGASMLVQVWCRPEADG